MLTNDSWTIVGLTLNIVGIIFLASSITFKRPRRVVQEFFGIEKVGSLKAIREYLLNKVQVYIGFTFLISGFVMQIAVQLARSRPPGSRLVFEPNFLIIVGVLLASIIGVTILLKILQIFWSNRVFKKLLIEFFRDFEWPLEQRPALAKEIGELLEIPQVKDESVDEYLHKVRKALRIDEVETARRIQFPGRPAREIGRGVRLAPGIRR
ncbi:MAG: hypothetical protein U1E76_20795 [Planctomycetota bacterium]